MLALPGLEPGHEVGDEGPRLGRERLALKGARRLRARLPRGAVIPWPVRPSTFQLRAGRLPDLLCLQGQVRRHALILMSTSSLVTARCVFLRSLVDVVFSLEVFPGAYLRPLPAVSRRRGCDT